MPKRTPFYAIHKQLEAKIIDFGGWEMPVRYQSIKKEHQAVRNKVGLFDVSHMGEFFVEGPEAVDLIQHISINDASKLKPGKAQYSAMCYPDGGIVDDLIIYMLDVDKYMMVVNASNIEKDFEWINTHNNFDAVVADRSDAICLLALQGPGSVEVLQKLTDTDLEAIKFYSFEKGKLAGFGDIILSATGYTGEKGFELYFDKQEADPAKVWNALMDAGTTGGIQPCGLGARDTLRLEMGFALYGNDISRETNPLEARLSWLTKLDKSDFVGKEALQKVKEEGVKRKLIGFSIDERRSIPRQGYDIVDEQEQKIGVVTSGSRSITLDKNIGMGYIPAEKAVEGTKIYIRLRNRIAEAEVVSPPFLKH